jgi:hypothetical protein
MLALRTDVQLDELIMHEACMLTRAIRTNVQLNLFCI